MAAKNYLPRRPTDTTVAGTSTINHDFTETASRRWVFDLITVEFGTQDASNTVDIQTDATGSFLNIWEQVSNFKRQKVDFSAEYPRGVELDAGKILRVKYTRGVSSTIDTALPVIERDI